MPTAQARHYDEHHIIEELEDMLPQARKEVPPGLLVRPTVLKLLRISLVDWSVIVIAWLGMLYLPSWTYPVTLLLAASRFHSLGVILHDLSHLGIRQKTATVRLLEALVGYPMGSTLNAMRYHHLRHHRDNGMPTDPYFKPILQTIPVMHLAYSIRGLILVLFWIVRGVYGSMAYYLPTLRNSYARIFLQDKSGKELSTNKEVIQCAGEDRWQLIFHIPIWSLVFVQPRAFIFGYLVPVMIAGLLAAHRLMMEHEYTATSDRSLETILATTCDHNLSGVASFMLAPRNIGYHIAHHLHPQVASYHLPQLRLWYKNRYPHSYPQRPRKASGVFAAAFRLPLPQRRS